MSDSDRDSGTWRQKPSSYLSTRPARGAVVRPRSLYVGMTDGCRLAVDVYPPPEAPEAGADNPDLDLVLPAVCAKGRRAAGNGAEPEAIPFLKRFTIFNTDQIEEPAGRPCGAAGAASRKLHPTAGRGLDPRDRHPRLLYAERRLYPGAAVFVFLRADQFLPDGLPRACSLEAFRTPASVHPLTPVTGRRPKTLNVSGHFPGDYLI
jgi:hypothetical protein